MTKENVVPGPVRDSNGIMTRARAAAMRVSAKMPPKAPKRQEPNAIMQRSSKRAALDENKSSSLDKGGAQCKRRAVLQDVTNVCCEKSYRSCFNATKVQVKQKKQIKPGHVNTKKLIPSVAMEPWHLQENLQMKNVPKTVEDQPRLKDKDSVVLVKDVSFHLLNLKGLSKDGCLDHDRILGVPQQQSLEEGTTTLKDPDMIDIDSDLKDPQLCSLYATEIYSNLRVAELARNASPEYMETVQHDITPSMRAILVDWLVEVSEEYKLVTDTLYLTVRLIDQYLSQNYIGRQRLQLLGITCMLIASKYEEICAPQVEEFCYITDSTYTREEVLKMESNVLKYFGFNISGPTTKTFVRRFLRAAQASYKSLNYELAYLADYLAELTLVNYAFLNVLPSVTAASAIFLARWTLDQTCHPWNPTLIHYTTYKASDLKSTVFALQDLQLNTKICPLAAIRIKYKQEKFKSVASLSSPKLLESLF